MNAKAIALVLMAAVSLPAIAQTNAEQPRNTRYDREIQEQVAQDLQKKDALRGIGADVEEGIVTLSGEVNLYIEKVNAEKRVRKVKNVDGVRNHIKVEGEEVSDADLREKLANKLRYDRIGYGIIFNSLSLAVEDGAITIGGNVRNYPDRDSAVAIVATTPGVRDVVDEIEVAPLSGFDDGLRVQLARAIYGHMSLQKYAFDPQAPIRIVVENGNVELAGVVMNEGDRQVAYMQARSVPGVFSVRNNLLVAVKADQ